MEYNSVKDSGERQHFQTGAHRDVSKGKGRFDLLPAYVLLRDAKHMENGAVKYGDRNWEKGIPMSRFLDSAMRHICCYMMGMRDEDHLAAARWNLAGLIWTEEMVRRGSLPAELNDIPRGDYGSEEDQGRVCGSVTDREEVQQETNDEEESGEATSGDRD